MTKGKLLLTSSGITNDSIQQALVDQSALKVSDGEVDVITRGQWKLFGIP
jgi:hypothetical protein